MIPLSPNGWKALQEELEALKGLQAESRLRLEQLLPAMLDRAFEGEL